MKQLTIMSILFFGVSNLCLGQDVISGSICYVLGKTTAEYEQIYVIGKINLKECNAAERLNLKIISHEDLETELTSKKAPVLEYRIIKIEGLEVQIKCTWYNIFKKHKKIKKAIEGSIILTYCYDCKTKEYKLVMESAFFH